MQMNAGTIFWLTGFSGVGKTTLAKAVNNRLLRDSYNSLILDGDVIGKGLNSDLKFTAQYRPEHNRKIAEVAKMHYEAGLVVVVSCISPFSNDTMLNKKICNTDRFYEVFIDCPLSICEERDVKGLYKSTRSGQLKVFTGIASPYEMPGFPGLDVDTAKTAMENSVNTLYDFVNGTLKAKKNNLIK